MTKCSLRQIRKRTVIDANADPAQLQQRQKARATYFFVPSHNSPETLTALMSITSNPTTKTTMNTVGIVKTAMKWNPPSRLGCDSDTNKYSPLDDIDGGGPHFIEPLRLMDTE